MKKHKFVKEGLVHNITRDFIAYTLNDHKASIIAKLLAENVQNLSEGEINRCLYNTVCVNSNKKLLKIMITSGLKFEELRTTMNNYLNKAGTDG